MTKLERFKVQKYINNLSYPTNFEEILNKVKQNGATENELHIIQRLPKKLFTDPTDLDNEINSINL